MKLCHFEYCENGVVVWLILTLTCCCCTQRHLVHRTVRHAYFLATVLRGVMTASTITNWCLPPALWTVSLLPANATVRFSSLFSYITNSLLCFICFSLCFKANKPSSVCSLCHDLQQLHLHNLTVCLGLEASWDPRTYFASLHLSFKVNKSVSK